MPFVLYSKSLWDEKYNNQSLYSILNHKMVIPYCLIPKEKLLMLFFQSVRTKDCFINVSSV